LPFFGSLPFSLYASKEYAPSSAPSATAPASAASASGSANAAFFAPFSARAAVPAARRSASASKEESFSGSGPRPTATTSGVLKPDGAGSFVTSPSAPEAPRVSRTPASLPS